MTTRSVPRWSRDQRDRRALAVDLGQLVGAVIASRVRVAGLEHPAAVGGDADRDDVVALAVDRLRARCPAVTQEIACSLERPPKTTATRGLRPSGLVHRRRPYPPTAGRACRRPHDLRPHLQPAHRSPSRPAARPHEPDAPLNTPLTMASTYVAGGDLEYGRYGNPTWTAFEDALGALEGGRCLAFASGLAAVATVLDLVGHGGKVVAPRHAYNGTSCSSPTSRRAAG